VQGPHQPGDHDPAAVTIRIKGAGLAAVACAIVATPAHAARQPTALPSPFFPVRSRPPVRASPIVTETRFPGHLSSSQVVRVSVNASGRPVRIVDVDRIGVAAKGDYSFVIAAPVEDVRAAAGSASEPGLRSQAVVWQGFSAGRRLLAAEITLRVGAAARALPLRIDVGRAGLRLVNMTSTTVTTIDAPVAAGDIAQALDTARRALEAHTPVPATVVDALGPIRNVRVAAQVPLRVRGSVRFSGQPSRKFARVVGGRPAEIAGSGSMEALELTVAVPNPASVVRPPGGGSWLDLQRSRRLVGGREATRLAVNRLLSAALALQFRQFLGNPDPVGATETSYRYQLAVSITPPSAEKSEGGHPWLVTVSVALGIIAATAAALVLWAHS
jgi:hypothetical protein